MSGRIIRHVRDHADCSGADFAVLIVLATYADKDGRCWPAMETVAKSARVTLRSAYRAVSSLCEKGLLTVEHGGGRFKTNRYLITIDGTATAPVKHPETVTECQGINTETLTQKQCNTVTNPDIDDKNPDIRSQNPDTVSPELSRRVIKNSHREEGDAREAAPSFDADECDDAMQAWNAMADRTGLPKCQLLSKTRRNAIRARIKQAGGIEGWRAAIAKVEASRFCTGGNDRGWRANIDFLARESSFIKLMEGVYDTRSDDRPGGGRRSLGEIADEWLADMDDGIPAERRRH